MSEVRFAMLESENKVSIIKTDAPEPSSEKDDIMATIIYEQARQCGLPEE